MKKEIKGLTYLYTGEGKGKTTASVGLAVRASGQGMKVAMLQFIKSPERTYGEQEPLEKLGVFVEQVGIGFTWLKTPEEHREALKIAFLKAKKIVASGEYDLVILDELNNALAIDTFPIEDVLPLEEVKQMITKRPEHVHLLITGRSAKEEIKELADLVTVMKEEKHYYNDGIPAIKGIEF